MANIGFYGEKPVVWQVKIAAQHFNNNGKRGDFHEVDASDVRQDLPAFQSEADADEWDVKRGGSIEAKTFQV